MSQRYDCGSWQLCSPGDLQGFSDCVSFLLLEDDLVAFTIATDAMNPSETSVPMNPIALQGRIKAVNQIKMHTLPAGVQDTVLKLKKRNKMTVAKAEAAMKKRATEQADVAIAPSIQEIEAIFGEAKVEHIWIHGATGAVIDDDRIAQLSMWKLDECLVAKILDIAATNSDVRLRNQVSFVSSLQKLTRSTAAVIQKNKSQSFDMSDNFPQALQDLRMNLKDSIALHTTFVEHGTFGKLFHSDMHDPWHLTHLDGRFADESLQSTITCAEATVQDNIEEANAWITQMTKDLSAMCLPGWQLKRDTLIQDTEVSSALLKNPDYKKLSPAASQLHKAVVATRAIPVQNCFHVVSQ